MIQVFSTFHKPKTLDKSQIYRSHKSSRKGISHRPCPPTLLHVQHWISSPPLHNPFFNVPPVQALVGTHSLLTPPTSHFGYVQHWILLAPGQYPAVDFPPPDAHELVERQAPNAPPLPSWQTPLGREEDGDEDGAGDVAAEGVQHWTPVGSLGQ